jgi:hypothetical protein
MSRPNSPSQDAAAFFASLHRQLLACLSKLEDLDAEALARASGFLERSPRKIPMSAFLKGLLAVASETDLTLEHIANAIGLAAHITYRKQSLEERLDPDIETFLALIITALLGQFTHSVPTGQAFAPFARVLVQDSTSETLPKNLAACRA